MRGIEGYLALNPPSSKNCWLEITEQVSLSR